MKGENMSTGLMDTPLFKMLATPKAEPFFEWCEANKASLFISAGLPDLRRPGRQQIAGVSVATRKRSINWLDELSRRFADRTHPVGATIAIRAGSVLPSLTNSRHRFHDALLVATAQIHDHRLITRREETFGPWTKIQIATV
jgi:hypothetical protein